MRVTISLHVYTIILCAITLTYVHADVWQDTFHNPVLAKKLLDPIVKRTLVEYDDFAKTLPDVRYHPEIHTWLNHTCNIDELLQQEFVKNEYGFYEYNNKPILFKLTPDQDFLMNTVETLSYYVISLGKWFFANFPDADPGIIRWSLLHEIAHIKDPKFFSGFILKVLQSQNNTALTIVSSPRGLSWNLTMLVQLLTRPHDNFLDHHLLNHHTQQGENHADRWGIQHIPHDDELKKLNFQFEYRCKHNKVRTKHPHYASVCTLHQWCLDEMRARGMSTHS